MALRIRLARAGAKKRPFYHIVVADARAPRDGRHIERLGSYNPLIPKTAQPSETKDKGRMRVALNEERIKFWLARGAQPSDRIAQFLSAANMREAPARHNPQKAKPKAKAQARAQAAQEAQEAKIKEAKEKKEVKEKEAAEAATKEEKEEAVSAAPEEQSAEEAPAEEMPTEESAAEPSSAQDEDKDKDQAEADQEK